MDILAALRGEFVNGIPGRLRIIEERWRARDRQGVTSEVHKLRGAAGGFGFPALAEAAARLEDALNAGAAPGDPELDEPRASLLAAARIETSSEVPLT